MNRVSLADVLHQFGLWEAEAMSYKQLLLDAVEQKAELEWATMAAHIDRMTLARDSWLDLSQQYCEQKAQRGSEAAKDSGRSGSGPA